jgi:hypothetical protein
MEILVLKFQIASSSKGVTSSNNGMTYYYLKHVVQTSDGHFFILDVEQIWIHQVQFININDP